MQDNQEVESRRYFSYGFTGNAVPNYLVFLRVFEARRLEESTNSSMDTVMLLRRVLAAPAAGDLLNLQVALLSAEKGAEQEQQRFKISSALAVLDDFYDYIVELQGKLDAHAFAELASKLDIGAVGGVVLENIFDAGKHLMQRMLIGGLSETLMVLASRQYVKAYNRDLDAMHRQSAWRVRSHLWRLSAANRPELTDESRTALVDALLAPVLEENNSREFRAALLGRLFQVLLLCHVTAFLSNQE
jgi:hypothetical protein